MSRDPQHPIARRRRALNYAFWLLSSLGLVLVVIPVVWILGGMIGRGVASWRWSVLTERSTGIGGGLANAIVGTVVIMFGVGVIAGVVGIGCGVHLGEMRSPGRLTTLLRSAFEILSGIPSIVFGYVGYVALVVGLHWQFSLLAAVVVLSALVVPYIAKATELSLNQVPLAYREGGEALGMTTTQVLRRLVLRSAIPGISTGLIFALAISVGETAPLLYTAGWSNSYPTGALVHSPVGYLTYATFSFFDDPSPAVRDLSYEAGLLLVVLVLLLILTSRVVIRVSQRYAPSRSAGADAGRNRGIDRMEAEVEANSV